MYDLGEGHYCNEVSECINIEYMRDYNKAYKVVKKKRENMEYEDKGHIVGTKSIMRSCSKAGDDRISR